MKERVTGYAPAQVALHWVVVVLIAFQFVAQNVMERTWRTYVDGGGNATATPLLANLHVAGGLLILLLALARLWLRWTRGAPAPPADEPRALQWLAEGVHWLIYLLILLLPGSGVVTWFLGVRGAGNAHAFLTNILLGAIALHVAGALFQHFVRRSDVLMRMFKPQSR